MVFNKLKNKSVKNYDKIIEEVEKIMDKNYYYVNSFDISALCPSGDGIFRVLPCLPLTAYSQTGTQTERLCRQA